MKTKLETEIRFFFDNKKLNELRKILSRYQFLYSAHELTVMYDNPNPKFSFYNPKVDGRLRLRTTEIIDSIFGKPSKEIKSSGLLTWKRRLPEKANLLVRQEEEVECAISIEDAENMSRILEKVLKCRRISSYERIRHVFEAEKVCITLDQFPFGLMLEFELFNAANLKFLFKEINNCGLNLKNASKLSCDDKYAELCLKLAIRPKTNILFNNASIPKSSDNSRHT